MSLISPPHPHTQFGSVSEVIAAFDCLPKLNQAEQALTRGIITLMTNM